MPEDSAKCVVLDCVNAKKDGGFIGNMCTICFNYVHRNLFNKGRTTADWGRGDGEEDMFPGMGIEA